MFTAMALIRLALLGRRRGRAGRRGARPRARRAEPRARPRARDHARRATATTSSRGSSAPTGWSASRSTAPSRGPSTATSTRSSSRACSSSGSTRTARVRLYNREAERVTGFARDEVLGRALRRAPARRARATSTAPFVAARRARARGRRARRARERDPHASRQGARRALAARLRALGEPTTRSSSSPIGQDTTDENALAARVRQSEKLAAVGTLAAGLAHEIRNPLNGAQLHVTFLERGAQARATSTTPRRSRPCASSATRSTASPRS